ncbi:hypothetical protein BDY19DRAFT_953961 [Irpex rosettiformis]|uniref:Uncharacterized protein n=1 Tax=Irpex rosettiformis TaxID=378272 RepID=A0ACB8TZQ7_9APHY|nr:hypothetical protein BDY19DRAFT_953961 [Irpex rosettiformis]
MYVYCAPCNRDFRSKRALIQHYVKSYQHHYCQFCEDHFYNAKDLKEHNVNAMHARCNICMKEFQTGIGMYEHIRQAHPFCELCRRSFRSQNNLNMHLTTSPVHNARNYVCPGRDCGRSFVKYADLAAHLESATCPGGFTRRNLNAMVIGADTNNVITNPARLIGYGQETSQVVNTWATGNAWNGHNFECVLCHREFRLLSALNAHLNSPAHEQNIYRCPTQFNGCAGEYRTLSALLSHIERSECGVARFRSRLTIALDNVASGVRRLTIE